MRDAAALAAEHDACLCQLLSHQLQLVSRKLMKMPSLGGVWCIPPEPISSDHHRRAGKALGIVFT